MDLVAVYLLGGDKIEVVRAMISVDIGPAISGGVDLTIELTVPESRLQRRHHIHDRFTLDRAGLEYDGDPGLERR